jgi:hypothetical protein
VEGEGAGIDGMRGVTVGIDRHRQHWQVAVRLSWQRAQTECTDCGLPSEGKFVVASPEAVLQCAAN